MLTLQKHKNNTYKTYKALTEFELQEGEDINSIRNKRITSIQQNLRLINNQYSNHNKKLLIAEIEGILQVINNFCPEVVYYSGEAKLNGNIVNYDFMEIYHYKLLEKGSESIDYRIIKKLHTETDHKINGENKGRFAVDIDSKFIYLST